MGTHYRSRKKHPSSTVSKGAIIVMAFGLTLFGGTSAMADEPTLDATATVEPTAEPTTDTTPAPETDTKTTEAPPEETTPVSDPAPVAAADPEPIADTPVTPATDKSTTDPAPASDPAPVAAAKTITSQLAPVTGTATLTLPTCLAPGNLIDATPAPGGIWTVIDSNRATYVSAPDGGIHGLYPLAVGMAFGDITIVLKDSEGVIVFSASWTTIDPATLECNDPDPDPDPNPEPTCVAPEDVNWSYTSVEVTATPKKDAQDNKFCDPLAVSTGIYTYDLPAHAAPGKPSRPQTLAGHNDVLIDSFGTFSYGVDQQQCVQIDTYAKFVSQGPIVLLPKLYGNDKDEPPFLHETLPGAGPSPTWSFTTSEGCNTPPAPWEAKVVTTSQKKQFVCGDSVETGTSTTTTTPYLVVLQDGKWVNVEDTEHITTVTEPTSSPLTAEEIESCKPAISPPKVETIQQDKKWVCGDTEVTGTFTTITTPYKAELVEGSTYRVVEDTEHASKSGVTTTRSLTSDERKSCVVAASASSTLPPVLASTGSEVLPLIGIGAGLVVGGVAMVLLKLRRRKLAVVQD
ncbi:MAG: hypothetical protein ACOH18_03005 [Candidatus Saccharimonadaceae bacterium]